jgi:peptide/nickel transport system substrate-binding protein
MTDHRVTRRRFIQSGAAGAGVLAASSLFPGVTEVTLQQASAQGDDRGVLIMRGTDAMLPETFNPLLNDNRVWLYDGLVRFDEEMNPIPDLAESWEISEDGTVYTIKLREEVKFHDGTVMTADDVLYTAELTLDESINSPYRNKFIIDGEPVVWEKLDDYTVQATLPHPFGPFLSKLSRADEIFFCVLPKHLLESCAGDMQSCDFNLQPVGTGPYKFVEYVPGQRLVMEAHDDYHQGRPGLKQVVRLAYPNEQSALAALKSGEIDAGPLREAGNVKAAEEDPNLTVHRYDSNWIFAGRMDTAHPILQEKAVREAIAHAIDRENLVKAAVSPTATVGNSPISIGWAASPDVPVFGYDPEVSKQLLEEAGWTGDGIRQKDGVPLGFTVTLYPDYAAPDIAAAMQQFLQQVGIELKINQLEYANFQTEIYANKNFDMYLDWQGFGVDPDIASRWTTATSEKSDYLDNPSNYSNPEVDKALQEAALALTQEERAEYLRQAQNLITADVPAVWLYLWQAQWVTGPNVENLSLPASTADMDNQGIWRENWKATSKRK